MATISGKWKFNDVLTLVGDEMWWYNFSYDVSDYNCMYTTNNEGMVTFWYDGQPVYAVGSGWYNKRYQTIDFGDTEQTVEDSFYEWFTANATKAMTLADKLAVITENEQKVYDAGKSKGFAEGESKGYEEGHTAGYTEGLNKGGYTKGYEDGVAVGTEQGKEVGMAEGIEAGKQAEYDAFWDALQQNGNATNYTYAFYGSRWTDEMYNPKYPITIENGNGVYQNSKITDTKVPIDVTDIGNNGQVFIWASKLVTINKLIVGEDTYAPKMFESCTALENITIEGVIGRNFDIHWSTKLTADSIRSIIEHLSDTAEGETLTLSQTAVDTAIANGGLGDNATRISTSGTYQLGNFTSQPISLSAGQTIKVSLFVDEEHFIGNTDVDGTTDWVVGLWNSGLNAWESAPYNDCFTYTATKDEIISIPAYFTTPIACDAVFTIKAVLVDSDGNEITGENLYKAADFEHVTDAGVTCKVTSTAWETLAASKPNWTISLV